MAQTAAAPALKVGDKVRWESSGVEKIGEITHIVPAGKRPPDVGVAMKDIGKPRDHETYVVRGRKYRWSSKKFDGPIATYWPHVSLLKLIEQIAA